jgi:hypothetical protein
MEERGVFIKKRDMKASIYIIEDKIGETDFQIIDRTMGAIGGSLAPNSNYQKYQAKIQEVTAKKRIANIDNFPFSIVMSDNTILVPAGGIGITDVVEVNEIYVEAAGIDSDILEQIETIK